MAEEHTWREVPLIDGVREIDPNRWSLGPQVECRLIEHTPPEDALATWSDGEDTYVLLPKQDGATAAASTLIESDHPSTKVKLVNQGGSQGGVWRIGRDVFCRVHYWRPDVLDESVIIDYVKEHFPQIPVPEVIREWNNGDKCFFLTKRVPGQLVQDAWPALSAAQQDKLLTTIVDIIELLASKTSDRLEGLHGMPLPQPWLNPVPDAVQFDPPGPLTREECVSRFIGTKNHPPPPIDRFQFYHSGLGPNEIFVSADGELTGIIDWECAGFHPRFWVASLPSCSPHFDFNGKHAEGYVYEWRKGLIKKLQAKGYPALGDWYIEFVAQSRAKKN